MLEPLLNCHNLSLLVIDMTDQTVTDQLLNQLRRKLTKEQFSRLAYVVGNGAYGTVKVYGSFTQLEAHRSGKSQE